MRSGNEFWNSRTKRNSCAKNDDRIRHLLAAHCPRFGHSTLFISATASQTRAPCWAGPDFPSALDRRKINAMESNAILTYRDPLDREMPAREGWFSRMYSNKRRELLFWMLQIAFWGGVG